MFKNFCTVVCRDGKQEILMPDGTKVPGVVWTDVQQGSLEAQAGEGSVVLKLLVNIDGCETHQDMSFDSRKHEIEDQNNDT